MIRVTALRGCQSESGGYCNSHINGDSHWGAGGGNVQMLLAFDTVLSH